MSCVTDDYLNGYRDWNGKDGILSHVVDVLEPYQVLPVRTRFECKQIDIIRKCSTKKLLLRINAMRYLTDTATCFRSHQ